VSDLKYEPVLPATREELEVLLKSDSPETVARALYAATKYEVDWSWVQDQCLKALTSPEVSVRWAAATCLGDLAFLRRSLNVEAVVPALEAATKDATIADPASLRPYSLHERPSICQMRVMSVRADIRGVRTRSRKRADATLSMHARHVTRNAKH
jgi:hypothetical protein